MQRGVFGICARVATDQVQLRHRYEEFRVVGVVNPYEFASTLVALNGFQAAVASYAVIQMHHGITGF